MTFTIINKGAIQCYHTIGATAQED